MMESVDSIDLRANRDGRMELSGCGALVRIDNCDSISLAGTCGVSVEGCYHKKKATVI